MRTPVTRIERATGLFLLIVTMLGVLAVVGAGRRSEIVEVFRARIAEKGEAAVLYDYSRG